MCLVNQRPCQVSNQRNPEICSFYQKTPKIVPQPAVLERRRDGSTKQYSVETELLLPGVLGTRMLGLMEQRGSVWNSALRLKYGLGGKYADLCGGKKCNSCLLIELCFIVLFVCFFDLWYICIMGVVAYHTHKMARSFCIVV